MTWSLTKLKKFEQCGAKYDFRYNQKLPEQPSVYAQRGKDYHTELELFIKGERSTLTGPLEFYFGFLSALKSNSVPLHTEYRIALKADWSACPDGETPWFVGYLDLFRQVEVSAHNWDWKTGKIYPDHIDDMEVYGLSILARHPEIEVVTVTYVYLDKGQNREKIFSRQFDFPLLKEKWAARVKKMEEATTFIPNPTYMCRFCSYSKVNGGPCAF